MDKQFVATTWKSHDSLVIVIPKNIAKLIDLQEGEKIKVALIGKVGKK